MEYIGWFVGELIFIAYAIHQQRHGYGPCICRSAADEYICVRYH